MADNLIIESNQFSSNVDEKHFDIVASALRKSCLNDDELKDYFELERCFKCITKFEMQSFGNSKDDLNSDIFVKVGLQFPDHMLCNSARVAQLIEENVKCKTYIMADTTYGSCCVDKIAAEHIKVDFIIHFGSACLSRTDSIPVIFVFGKEKINIEECCVAFRHCFEDKSTKIILAYDVVYHHSIDQIYTKLSSEYKSLIPSRVKGCDNFIMKSRCCNTENFPLNNSNEVYDSSFNDECNENISHFGFRFGREFNLEDGCSVDDYVVFYIGKESLTLTNHMMTLNKCEFYSYDPEMSTCRKETLNVNRHLMKRYYLIEKAKDAQTVGILVATIGIVNSLQILKRIKTILRKCGKKFYTFVVGKINAEKLANFMEIDIFVIIACPENSLINSQEFYKPVITPFEIEVACTRARQWTGEYITDFQELLPGAASHVNIEDQESEFDVPDMSLISGHLRPKRSQKDSDINIEKSTALAARNMNATLSCHHSAAAEFLAQRSWKGLEIKKGETQVSKAIEGRNGIASSYTHETGHSSGAEYSDEDNLMGANRLKQSECCELMATRLVSTQTT
ncbi:2-(3-amino-3-carboxypropyl)histidine synthase subunit 2-like [Xenia sp. Carnegie-2017]|uniref:2-(3-amino-3-carboxypropyl)histidine synthase subunit 2-like n=1 Tax=Xenia sp. Carnegie-2017 TaxID=2897299 RepID=UPI001F0356C7|nr:2-(3-amino-3-carboxypropyl)histidine synthase subunit 2-like [Xenia sp. Carnegie-2017]